MNGKTAIGLPGKALRRERDTSGRVSGSDLLDHHLNLAMYLRIVLAVAARGGQRINTSGVVRTDFNALRTARLDLRNGIVDLDIVAQPARSSFSTIARTASARFDESLKLSRSASVALFAPLQRGLA